jgi:hypothetical protein
MLRRTLAPTVLLALLLPSAPSFATICETQAIGAAEQEAIDSNLGSHGAKLPEGTPPQGYARVIAFRNDEKKLLLTYWLKVTCGDVDYESTQRIRHKSGGCKFLP